MTLERQSNFSVGPALLIRLPSLYLLFWVSGDRRAGGPALLLIY